MSVCVKYGLEFELWPNGKATMELRTMDAADVVAAYSEAIWPENVAKHTQHSHIAHIVESLRVD